MPKALIFGHPSPVTALAIANDKWEKASIVSATQDGLVNYIVIDNQQLC